MDALSVLGLTWDDGVPVGFQVGKSAALLDHAHRKDQEAFRKLCARLYARNWSRKLRREDPERARTNCRAWREKNRERVREIERERTRKARLQRRPMCVCDQCGKRWKPAPKYAATPGVRQRKGRFCSVRCANRWHGARRQRARGLRQMDISRVVADTLRSRPWLTPKAVCERAPQLKPGSVATLLSVWHRDGRVQRRKAGRAYEYAVKP